MVAETYPVRSRYRTDTASQLVRRPVESLLSVSPETKELLNSLGISTVFDLGASSLFDSARRIVEAADLSTPAGTSFVGADFFDAGSREKSLAQLADSPVSALRQVSNALAQRIEQSLGVSTIRELASWPPYRTARAAINDAYGTTASIVEDPERPDDLIPVARRYATERVQYDVIVMDKVLGSFKDRLTPAMLRRPTRWTDVERLETAGAIDVGDLVDAALVARPAIGAVLTYRQSWFPQGLALGQLLHSMALAPGESTRIAMVDWSRNVRAQRTDDTTQRESLYAEIERNRSMEEVTQAVAAEAQVGFSGTSSTASQSQGGISGGIAGILPGPALGVGAIGGSYSSASASTRASGWSSSFGSRSLNAEMTQNINDRTHQAANAVRNRRATAIMETSQQESETLSTRVVTNYNHMHPLTIQYFEVVQIYRVVVELARVTRCIFIPMKLVTFTPEVIRRYRTVIAGAGLIPEVRALSAISVRSLVLRAPNQQGEWDAKFLTSVAVALGSSVGAPDDTAIYLPIEQLKLWYVAFSDLSLMNVFETIEVYSRNGSVYAAKLQENVGPLGGCIAMIENAFSPQDISHIVLRRKEEEGAFEGTVGAAIAFDYHYPDAGPPYSAADRVDQPLLYLRVPIKISANNPNVVVFEFDQIVADSEVIDHLEQNALHYSTAIWRSLDAATITTLLSTYTLGGEPLIHMIDPVPISVLGNYVVFRLYAGDDQDDWKEFLRKNELVDAKPREDLVPLPSSGVFAEAVLGRSNAAEKLDLSRFWNWQDSPIPILPPEINPLTAGGRSSDVSLQTGNLESPVINITAAPALPDPAGLAPLYSAIANGNMFRDMSGMNQIAGLAGAALSAAQSGAGQAMSAAGAAQQVAAQMFTDVLEMALQAALAANGLPPMSGRASGGRTGEGASAVPQNPTNLGALMEAAKDLDAAEVGNPGDWAAYPGESSVTANGEGPLSAPPLIDSPMGRSTSGVDNTKHQSAILHGKDPETVSATGNTGNNGTSNQWTEAELEAAWESIPGAARGFIHKVVWEESYLIPAGFIWWNFEPGEANVKDRFAEAMSELPVVTSGLADLRDRGYKLVITGSASVTGSEERNQMLAQQRADTLKVVLIERYGIPGNRIETKNVGERACPVPPEVAAQWGDFRTTWLAWNRRVVVEPRAPQPWAAKDYDDADAFVQTWSAIGEAERARLRALIGLLRDPKVDDWYLAGSPRLDLRVFFPTVPDSPETQAIKRWFYNPSGWKRFTWFRQMREDVALAAQGEASAERKAVAVKRAHDSLRRVLQELNQLQGLDNSATLAPVQNMLKWAKFQSDDPLSVYYMQRAQ